MEIMQHTADKIVLQAKKSTSLLMTLVFGLVLGVICIQIGLGSLRHNHGHRLLCERVEAHTMPLCRLLLPAPIASARQGKVELARGYLTGAYAEISNENLYSNPLTTPALTLSFQQQPPATVNLNKPAEAERHAQHIQQFLATPTQLRLELELIDYGAIMTRTLAGYPLVILGILLCFSFLLAILKWRDVEYLIFDRTHNQYCVKYRHWWGLRNGQKLCLPLTDIQSVKLHPIHQDDTIEQADTPCQLRLCLQDQQLHPLNTEQDQVALAATWQPIVTTLNTFLHNDERK